MEETAYHRQTHGLREQPIAYEPITAATFIIRVVWPPALLQVSVQKPLIETDPVDSTPERLQNWIDVSVFVEAV